MIIKENEIFLVEVQSKSILDFKETNILFHALSLKSKLMCKN